MPKLHCNFRMEVKRLSVGGKKEWFNRLHVIICFWLCGLSCFKSSIFVAPCTWPLWCVSTSLRLFFSMSEPSKETDTVMRHEIISVWTLFSCGPETEIGNTDHQGKKKTSTRFCRLGSWLVIWWVRQISHQSRAPNEQIQPQLSMSWELKANKANIRENN